MDEKRPDLFAGPGRCSNGGSTERIFGSGNCLAGALMADRERLMTRKQAGGKDSRTAALSECEEHREKLLDEAIEESFPASDPPSPARPAGKGC